MNRVRKSFAKTSQTLEPPHLIAMQRYSYERFLQRDINPDERGEFGLQAIFKNIFPITDFNGLCSLEFVRYSFGDPKYTVDECIERGMTYDVPVKITVRLITFDVDEERRLFYVAMTRAKEKLYLAHSKKRRIFGKLIDRELSPYVKDVEERLKKHEKSLLPKKSRKKKPHVQLELF